MIPNSYAARLIAASERDLFALEPYREDIRRLTSEVEWHQAFDELPVDEKARASYFSTYGALHTARPVCVESAETAVFLAKEEEGLLVASCRVFRGMNWLKTGRMSLSKDGQPALIVNDFCSCGFDKEVYPLHNPMVNVIGIAELMAGTTTALYQLAFLHVPENRQV